MGLLSELLALADARTASQLLPDAPRWLAPIFCSNGGVSTTSAAAGTVYSQLIQVQIPCIAKGIAYTIGAGPIAGNAYAGLVGGTLQANGLFSGILTEETPEGSNVIASSVNTAQAGTISRPQTILFQNPVKLGKGRFYLQFESETNATYLRNVQYPVGPGAAMSYQRAGAAHGALTTPVPACTYQPNGQPVLLLLCDPLPL